MTVWKRIAAAWRAALDNPPAPKKHMYSSKVDRAKAEALLAAGATLQAVGDEFGVTRERIRQLFPDHFDRFSKRLKRCTVESCSGRIPRGSDQPYCPAHQERFERRGTPTPNRDMADNMADITTCSTESCGRPRHTLSGLCEACYQNYRYHHLEGQKQKQKAANAKWAKKKRASPRRIIQR